MLELTFAVDHVVVPAGDSIANLVGTDQVDLLVGSSHGDSLTGGLGNDVLIGLAGDDILRGGAGADMLIGGDDIDTASYSEAPDGVDVSLRYGGGTRGEALGDSLYGIENLIGSDFADHLEGNALANCIKGEGGDDVIVGSGGTDILIGGEGDDTFVFSNGVELLAAAAINGDADKDTIVVSDSGAYTDAMFANARSIEAIRFDGWTGVSVTLGTNVDKMTDGSLEVTVPDSVPLLLGKATIDGSLLKTTDLDVTTSAGGDTVKGGAGNDVIRGWAGNDWLYGNDGADRLYGDGDDDHLFGGRGDDWLYGGSADDDLHGGAGADTLEGGSADDHLCGGIGNDFLHGGADKDHLEGGFGDDWLDGGSGNDTILGDGDLGDLAGLLISGPHAPTLTFSVSANAMDGIVWPWLEVKYDRNGDGIATDLYDTLHFTSTATLDYTAIYASKKFGLGDMTFALDRVVDFGGTASDYPVFRGMQIDGVDIPLDFVFRDENGKPPANVRALNDGGYILDRGAVSFNLKDLFDRGGDDFMYGGDGEDTLVGGAGDDHMTGGTDKDHFVYDSLNWGNDTIEDFTPGLDRIEFWGMSFTVADISLADDVTGVMLSVNGLQDSIYLDGIMKHQIGHDDIWFC